MSAGEARSHETVAVDLPRWVIKAAIGHAELVESDTGAPDAFRDSARATRNILEGRLDENESDEQ